jgi:peptidoglycan/xylan/chitin deacetylase (PgdA/CDA1 family)
MRFAHPSELVRRGAEGVDRRAARIGTLFERPALATILIHGIFASPDEADSGLVHPQEAIAERDVRELVERLRDGGFTFVDLDGVDVLAQDGMYACLTFDDGYASNLRLVELTRDLSVPATVFVATSYVQRQRRFWWDVVYAERRRRGASDEAIERELAELKRLAPAAIEEWLTATFGERAQRPVGELDRPLTPAELRELDAAPLVTVGNHTADHAILTVLGRDEVERQIAGAQDYLQRELGRPVRVISYPNGDVDDVAVAVARANGLTRGVTTVPRRERVPVPPARRMEIGRFRLRRGVPIETQAAAVRSAVQLTNTARRARAAARKRR